MPDALWQGYIQRMAAPELAMLLILLAEPDSVQDGMWWSIQNFPAWYCIKPSMRTSGTHALENLGLLRVTKKMLDTPRGGNGDDRDRVRNVYKLRGAALQPAKTAPAPPAGAKPSTPATKKRSRLKKKV